MEYLKSKQKDRRSARVIVREYAFELLNRYYLHNDPDVNAKLLAVEVIALRMSWNDIYKLTKFRDHK